MTLEDLFRQLSFSELSNLAVGNRGDGSIKTTEHGKITLFVNEGITDLYERFVIKEKHILLQEIEGKSKYLLDSAHAISSSATTPGPHYIQDSVEEPFLNDLIKITRIIDNNGYEYTLNIEGDELSMFTPEVNILQISYPKPDRVLAIGYQAGRSKTLEPANLEDELDIPNFLVPVLRHFVASQVYSNMNGAENFAVGQRHLSEYERKCALVRERDLLNEGRFDTATRFNNNGFV
jgi:hypothetical protein